MRISGAPSLDLALEAIIHYTTRTGSVMDNGLKLSVGETSSNFSWTRFIHLYANIFGKGKHPSLTPVMS